MEGLLTTKWILEGKGQVVEDFSKGKLDYLHQSMPMAVSNSNQEAVAKGTTSQGPIAVELKTS